MKKYFLFVFLFFLCFRLNAQCRAPFVEVKLSYFYPTSTVFREIFNDGGLNYQFSASFPLAPRYYLWGAVDYFSKRGFSIGGNNPTEVTIVPLTLGLKYLWTFNCLDIYGAAGFRHFIVHTRNDAPIVDPQITVNGLGGVVEAGTNLPLAECAFFNLFTSFSFKKLGTHTQRIGVQTVRDEVGGWNFGGGLGFKF